MKTLLTVLLAASLIALSRAADTNAKEPDYNAQYKLGPDSEPQGGVPHGEVIKMPAFTNSAIYPGTVRDWWIYVPRRLLVQQRPVSRARRLR